jgi:4-amino-4-deoxy-L-arabinose transferase-like glycosyltransferase
MSFLRQLTATEERRLTLLLLSLMAVVYIPFAGNYGMWDPWETHYGEVARQMVERNDWVSLWWPGSPLDKVEFWSKTVFTFWMMAVSMKMFGLDATPAVPAEFTDSWRVEWASRMPFILLSIVTIWSVFSFVRRLAGPRAAVIAAVALGTSSQWVFVTRQAMTDMPFVAPMTIALCLAGTALLGPEEEYGHELARRSFRLWRWSLSRPTGAAWWLFVGLFVLLTLPQLIVVSAQVTMVIHLRSATLRISGVVGMIPWFVAFVGGLLWAMHKRNKRELFLLSGYVLCAVATLAKGPAGVALPAIILVVYLVVAGRASDIFSKLELPLGIVISLATTCPWYHGMLIRHGMGFWNEFIGDNYVHRAAGRHGDRGAVDYYFQWIGYAMFPWSGIGAVATLFSLDSLRRGHPRRGLIGFALVWLLVELTVMTIVGTKFHHYILPALPAVAILIGVFVDDLLTSPNRLRWVMVATLGTAITFICGADLAAFPPRLLWLFNYDYVNMPGTGRPWPVVAEWGDRYEYGSQVLSFAVLAGLATLGLAIWAAISTRKLKGAVQTSDASPSSPHPYRDASAPAERAPAPEKATKPDMLVLTFAAIGIVATIVGITLGPKTDHGAAPTIDPLAWLIPTALMVPSLGMLVYALRDKFSRGAPWLLALVAVVWTGFISDKLLVELSPHWAQKHVIASYFNKRHGPDEPLIAWQLYWRGENFYTKNIIYNSTNPNEKTVFLGDRNSEKMQAFFHAHAGKKVFFIVERVRYESLKNLLPEAARRTMTIEDKTNNKLYLASAQL